MDLLQYDIDNAGPREMRLRYPDGKPAGTDKKPTTISLYGADSQEFKRAESRLKLKAVQQRQKRGELADMTEDELADVAREMVATDQSVTAELLASITAGCANLSMGDEEITPKNIRQAYERFSWLREQADAFISDRANFLPRASGN